MTFPLLGKSYFFACAAMPRNRAKRGAKTAGAQSAAPADAFRSATAAGGTWRGDRMFLCSPAAEQAANGWGPQPCPTTSRLYRAIAQSAMQKTAGAPSEAVPLSSRRRAGGEWLEPATLPYHEQAVPRNRAAMHKQLSSPKRSPPPHTPLKHPAMSLFCIHIPQNSCTIFVILLCRG